MGDGWGDSARPDGDDYPDTPPPDDNYDSADDRQAEHDAWLAQRRESVWRDCVVCGQLADFGDLCPRCDRHDQFDRGDRRTFLP